MIEKSLELLRSELAKAGTGSLVPASADDLALAEAFGFPEVLLEFYSEAAPDSKIGMVELSQRIWSIEQAIRENRDYVPGAYLFPLGYVVIGSTKFGDAYCLDTNHSDVGRSPVVLFPHDVVEDGASLDDVEPYRLVVAEDLDDFIVRFAQRTLVEQAKYKAIDWI